MFSRQYIRRGWFIRGSDSENGAVALFFYLSENKGKIIEGGGLCMAFYPWTSQAAHPLRSSQEYIDAFAKGNLMQLLYLSVQFTWLWLLFCVYKGTWYYTRTILFDKENNFFFYVAATVCREHYLRFRMRAKCVCCIPPLCSAPFSRANIILPCRAGFSGCPRRNHQPVAGIRAGGYLISVATHRGGLIQLLWFTTSIKVAVSILSASLCLPSKERSPW